jgi:hypothetical protein
MQKACQISLGRAHYRLSLNYDLNMKNSFLCKVVEVMILKLKRLPSGLGDPANSLLIEF